MRTATCSITRKRGVDIAIGEDEIVTLEERHDLALATIGKIRGVQQGERGWSEEPFLFAAARGGLYQRRRVPLREMKAETADFQPALQKIKLRALAGTVSAFDNDQRPGIGATGDRATGLRQRGFGGFRAERFRSGVLDFH